MLRWLDLNQDETDSDSICSSATTLGPIDTSLGDTRVGSPGRARTEQIARVLCWLIIAFLGVIAIYFSARLSWSYQHVRPILALSPTLEILHSPSHDPTWLGLKDGYRVIAVRGDSVKEREEYSKALSERRGNVIAITVDTVQGDSASRTERKELVWVELPALPRLELDEQLHITEAESMELTQLLVQPGYRVVAVNGTSVSVLDDYEKQVASTESRLLRITLTKGDSSEGTSELLILRSKWDVAWTLLVVGIVFGLLGLTALWLQPLTKSSWAFLVFSLYVGFFWSCRSIPFYHRLPMEQDAFLVLQCFLPLPTVLLLSNFTPFGSVVRRPFVPLLIAFVFGLALITTNFLTSPASANMGVLARPLFMIWALVMLSLVLISLPVDWWLRMKNVELNALDRQRGAATRIAAVAGFLPTTIFAAGIANFLVEYQETRILIELSVLLFPIVISYAIVRHNLLQISELLREGLILGSVMVGFGLVYSGATGVLLPMLDNILPEGVPLLNTIFVGGTILAAAIVYERTRNAIKRRFDETSGDIESFLALVDERSVRESSIQDFCAFIAKGLQRVIKTSHVNVLALSRHRGDASSHIESNSEAATLIHRKYGSLIDLLKSSRAEVFREDLDEFLGFSGDPQAVLRDFHDLNSAIAFPLVVHDEFLGVLCLGDKTDRKNFSSSEIDFLRRVAAKLSISISNYVERNEARRVRRIVDIYPTLPERIGPYPVDRLIGRGGMSFVFLSQLHDKMVAIKLANKKVQADEKLMERFLRESSVMLRLNHPNIVRIFEVGWEGEEPYIVLEYFPKGSLHQFSKNDHVMSEDMALDILLDAARGLSAAQKLGVIHRDVKPHNMFLDDTGNLKIGDFGLAKDHEDSTITSVGEVFGTVSYMSPEAVMGEPVDWRTDQYGLGVTMFVLLAGELPYKANTVQAQIVRQMNPSIPELRDVRQDAGKELSALIKRMMAKEPDERFGSYDELIGAASALKSES